MTHKPDFIFRRTYFSCEGCFTSTNKVYKVTTLVDIIACSYECAYKAFTRRKCGLDIPKQPK